jgi:hypothetical protein
LAVLPLSACGLLFGYPNTVFGEAQDAQNRRINATERATEPPSQRLPTNNARIGAELDEPERKADWAELKALFFGPRATPVPYRGELPRCLDDEVYSCSVTSGCRCRLKDAGPTKASATVSGTADLASDDPSP